MSLTNLEDVLSDLPLKDQPTKSRSRKLLWFAIVVVSVLIVLGGFSALEYATANSVAYEF